MATKPPQQSDGSKPLPDPRTCVICGKPQSGEYRPFCSKRCADVDLSRWLRGVYAIPAKDGDPEERPTQPSANDAGDA
jgi:endogenous inhibitor of DNA gyrase (YacG/DUF329 family)